MSSAGVVQVSSRLGLSVAIVEKHNCFGGVVTAGNVNVWHSLHDTIGERQVIGGLTQEVLDRLSVRDAVLTSPNPSVVYRPDQYGRTEDRTR